MINEQHIRVLIIEDDAGDSDLICELLSEAKNLYVDTERSDRLSSAIEFLRKKKFDVVLSDLGLPDSQGIETFMKLHTHYPNIPIIVLTGLSDEEGALQAVQKGAQDYFVKGQVDGSSLLRSVRYSIERKKLEEEILRARKLESIRILAGGIAHDFNNMLQTVMGNISLAKMHVHPGDEILQLLNNAERESKRAGALTRQLIELAKGGASAKKTAAIGELIRNTVLFSLSSTKYRAEFDIHDNLWPVEVDKGQIMQVIYNMALNSQEAMPEGGTVHIIAENSTVGQKDGVPLEEGEYVKVSVRDDGIGIPAENLSKIFDPYFTTKKMGVQKGMGLALAKCYTIIKDHHGLIAVDSKAGVGTTFHIYLPVSKEDRATTE